MKNSYPVIPLASSKKRPGDALTSSPQPPVAKKQKTDPQPPNNKDNIQPPEAKPTHPPSLTPRRPLPPPVVLYTKGPVTVSRVYYYPEKDAAPQSSKGQALPAAAQRTQGIKPPASTTPATPKAPRTTASSSQARHSSSRTVDGQKRYAFSKSDRPNKAKKSARSRARETIPAKFEIPDLPARSKVHAPSKIAPVSEKATQPSVKVPQRVEKKLTPEELEEQGKKVKAMMADIGLLSYKMPLRKDQLPSFRKKSKST